MTANLFGPDVGYIVIIALIVLIGGIQLPGVARKPAWPAKSSAKPINKTMTTPSRRSHLPNAAAAAPPPVTGAPSAPPAGPDQPVIQLSPAQLDGLLKAHEEEARRSG